MLIHDLELSLTALERIGPRGYLRYIFPMRLADGYDMDEVIRVLVGGYQAMIARLPVLACEAVPEAGARQKGAVRLQRLPKAEVGRATVRDLRAPGAYPWTYNEIRERKFSVSCFDGDVLLERGIWPTPDKGLPVSTLQLNFINGGVLLGWCALHMVGDANTYGTWTRVWAEECCRLQGVTVASPVVIDAAMIADRASVMVASGRNKGRREDHPEALVLPAPPAGLPPAMLSTSHRGQIFYFSPAALAALKAEAAPANATAIFGHPWISTHDAFAALVWRATVTAQVPLDSLEPQDDPQSVYGVAVDCRLRTDPPVHPNTLGCFLNYIAVSAPIRKVVSEYNLADLAGIVRQELRLRLTNQFTDDLATLVDGLDDVTCLIPTPFANLLGTSSILTSWAEMKLYDVQWGPLLGNTIEAVRAPNNGILPGTSVVFPRLPDGGIELLVGTEGALLPQICADPLFMKYAEAR